MTRNRLIGQVVVLLLMCLQAVSMYLMFYQYPRFAWIFLAMMVLLLLPDLVWRFVRPVIPDREGLIWATGWVVEKVDDVLAAVALFKNPAMIGSFILVAIFGALQVAGGLLVAQGSTLLGGLFIALSVPVWLVRTLSTVLLPNELQ